MKEPTNLMADSANLIEFAAANLSPRIMETSAAHAGNVLLIPKGMEAKDVTEFLDHLLPRPRRKTGTIHAGDLNSFINATSIHSQTEPSEKTATADVPSKSTVFIKNDGTELVAILNFHGAEVAEQDHCDLRVILRPTFSKEWTAWQNIIKGGAIGTAEFANLLDLRVEDIGEPPIKPVGKASVEPSAQRMLDLARIHKTTFAGQEELLLLARGLKVNVAAKVEENYDPATGEFTTLMETSHKGEKGALKVPGLFVLNIPVYDRGVVYSLACRLRYRVTDDGLKWSFFIINQDKALLDAVEDMKLRVETETSLSVWYGSYLG